MSQRGKSPVWRHLAIAVAGILPAFFLVFNAIFSDSSGRSEWLLVLLVIAVAYLVLGWLAGHWTQTRVVGLWLGSAAVLMVVLYSLREYDRLLLHAQVLAVALAAGAVGAALAVRRGGARRR